MVVPKQCVVLIGCSCDMYRHICRWWFQPILFSFMIPHAFCNGDFPVFLKRFLLLFWYKIIACSRFECRKLIFKVDLVFGMVQARRTMLAVLQGLDPWLPLRSDACLWLLRWVSSLWPVTSAFAGSASSWLSSSTLFGFGSALMIVSGKTPFCKKRECRSSHVYMFW